MFIVKILKKITSKRFRNLIRKIFFNIKYLFFSFLYLRIRIPKNNKISNLKFILKCDDLSGYSNNVILLNKIIYKYNIKISWGIIGKSLENIESNYFNFLLKSMDDYHYHFFNHGFLHNIGPDNYEFDGTDYKEQIDYISKTNILFKKLTNHSLDTFGAPCNHIDENTKIALSSFSEIKYWYFGFDNLNNLNLKRTLNIETTVGKPNYKFFINQLNQTNSFDNIITLQCHPNSFKLKHFFELILIIKFLLKNKCQFIVPSEI